MGLGDIEIVGIGVVIILVYFKEWYKELGIYLVEVYGMIEVCGFICNGL